MRNMFYMFYFIFYLNNMASYVSQLLVPEYHAIIEPFMHANGMSFIIINEAYFPVGARLREDEFRIGNLFSAECED